MKNRREFRCVYAGPEMFGGTKDDNDADNANNADNADNAENGNERPPYPDSFKEDGRESPLGRVDGDPKEPEKDGMRRGEPLMQAVYACPPLPPVSDGAPEPPAFGKHRMRCVYAGPEMFKNRDRRPPMAPVYAAPVPSSPMPSAPEAGMNEVYAGPDMTERNGLPVQERIENCPKCGFFNNASAKFCQNCGEKLMRIRICPACGLELAENAGFCSECGAQLDESDPATRAKMPHIRKGFVARPKGTRDELV